MEADSIVLWFSVIVFICVAIWAFWAIREFDRAGK